MDKIRELIDTLYSLGLIKKAEFEYDESGNIISANLEYETADKLEQIDDAQVEEVLNRFTESIEASNHERK